MSANISLWRKGPCGRFDSGLFGIERTMPVIMTGHIPDEDWNKICDDVDAYVAPLNNRITQCRYLSYIDCVITIVAIYFIFTQDGVIGWIIFSAFVGFSVVVLLLFWSTLKWGENKIFPGIKAYCDDMSNRYETLSFELHSSPSVRFDKSFITVSVNSNGPEEQTTALDDV